MTTAGKAVASLALPRKPVKKESQPKPLNAVIYTRVSTTRQAEYGNSLEDQEKVCRTYCKNNSFKVMGLFVEPGVTGRTDRRPAFQEMISFCKRNARKIACVVVYDTSRIFRDTMQYLYYKRVLQNNGIELISPNSQRGNSPVQLLTETTQAAFAQFESDLKSVRAKESRIEVRRRGRLTGKAPVGFINVRDTNRPRGTYVITDPERAPIIAEAFRKLVDPEVSIASVYRWAIEQGLTNRRTGRPLSPNTFLRLFENPTYAGLIEIDRDEFVEAEFEGIVSRKLFEKVLERMNCDLSSRVPRSRSVEGFPLKGVIRCPGCDKYLTASHQRGKMGVYYAYYHHPRHKPGCPFKGLYVPLHAADKAVLALLTRLKTERFRVDTLMDVVKRRHEEMRVSLRKRLSLLESEKRKQENLKAALREKYVLGDLDKDDYEDGRQRVDARLFEIRSEIRRLGEADIPVRQTAVRAMGVLELLETTWKASSDGQKSRIAKGLFPEGMSFGSGQSVGTPSNADQFGLCVLFDGGEKQLATPTGFEPVLPA